MILIFAHVFNPLTPPSKMFLKSCNVFLTECNSIVLRSMRLTIE